MQANPDDRLGTIWAIVHNARGFESTGYRADILERCLRNRLQALGNPDLDTYIDLLSTHPGELDLLVEALTIKYSLFFRDPIAFEYLNEWILPALLTANARKECPLRAWSAGCANGEEAYSLAILTHELARRDPDGPQSLIFATDIDERALTRARAATYSSIVLENVRRGLFSTSFVQDGGSWRVLPAIASQVHLSVHNMLDQRTAAPAESVFGSFELVLCRNVLIYYEIAYQECILEKIWRSMSPGGFLLLGQAETLPGPWQGRLARVTDCCSLFRKPQRQIP